MIKEYKIRKINNSGTVIEILDKTFNSPAEAYRYICNNPLDGEGKYFMRQIFGVSYMEENNLDDFRLEEYPNTKYDLTDDGTGKKYDTGKPMVGALCRVFPRALMAIGACIEFGTHKYPKPDNWKKVEEAYTRYQDSMIRHYLKHLQDQVKDNETGKLHLAHLCWNALAITELYLMEHPELMEELNK